MAYGVDFKGSNTLYRGNDDDVADLRVFKNGICIVSCWELTEDELKEITRTGKIFLSSMSGDTLVPNFVGSESITKEVVSRYGDVWDT